MYSLSAVAILKLKIKQKGIDFDEELDVIFQEAFTKEILNLKILSGFLSNDNLSNTYQDYFNNLTHTINNTIDEQI
jgi:hypothetical protein